VGEDLGGNLFERKPKKNGWNRRLKIGKISTQFGQKERNPKM
jgi:hypothetical protein